MQFVLRVDGRPITGERADVPGVDYIYNPQNDEKKYFDRVKRWYKAPPDGPHVYSEWSSIPDNPEMRERWFDYLALYKPMVTDGSRAYIDIKKSTLTAHALPSDAHATLYVNERKYLCISNLGSQRQTVRLRELWLDRQSGEMVEEVTLGFGDIVFLTEAS